ncbi:hypothetical protein [Mycobacterium sp. DL99]|uniref:hypothetical protein n=1 Tax=Mycobacterium sp. DL99 TaxID=2528957 RepID=UPI001081A896|nr:hypothetical protein [Mycobacterium sp. DL99]
MIDSRIINAHNDAKAAAAAADDARCLIHELLTEGPRIPEPERWALEQNLQILNRAMSRIDAVAGWLQRYADRTTQ